MLLVVARRNACFLLLADRLKVRRRVGQVAVNVVLARVRSILGLLPKGVSRCCRAKSTELDTFLLGDLSVLLNHTLTERRELCVVDVNIGAWARVR